MYPHLSDLIPSKVSHVTNPLYAAMPLEKQSTLLRLNVCLPNFCPLELLVQI